MILLESYMGELQLTPATKTSWRLESKLAISISSKMPPEAGERFWESERICGKGHVLANDEQLEPSEAHEEEVSHQSHFWGILLHSKHETTPSFFFFF